MERVMAWADEIGSEISPRSFMEYDVPQAVLEASKQAHTSRLFLGNARLEDIFGVDENYFTSYWDAMSTYYRAHGDLQDIDLPALYNSQTTERFPTLIERYLSQAFCTTTNACVVRSQAGITGTCFASVQVGDQIVAFHSFPMCFILRPFSNYYSLVGGIYLPGLMEWTTLTQCMEDGMMGEATFILR